MQPLGEGSAEQRIRKSLEEMGTWQRQNGGLDYLGLGAPGPVVGEGEMKGQGKGLEDTWGEKAWRSGADKGPD